VNHKRKRFASAFSFLPQSLSRTAGKQGGNLAMIIDIVVSTGIILGALIIAYQILRGIIGVREEDSS